MKKWLFLLLLFTPALEAGRPWGFYGHKLINRLAVFTLPPEMVGFYKYHIDFIADNAVNPDQRRYTVKDEAARHYIDLDLYGDSAWYKVPHNWKQAVALYTEDTLKARGIVPWHIITMKYRLTEAFKKNDAKLILTLSADIGHYIADAHVPLHTTSNYNGQLTNQYGIHGFWESRLPELFAENYDLLTGQAVYLDNPQEAAWLAVQTANNGLDSVLRFEQELTEQIGEVNKYAYEIRNGVNIKTYSRDFSTAYHQMLKGQVERQMKRAILSIGNFWYTCWVDAGQPDLRKLYRRDQMPNETYSTDEENSKETVNSRPHEQ